MKNFLLFILLTTLCLTCTSCSREETIALTKDNIHEYISIDTIVKDSTIEKELRSIYGFTYYSYDNSHAEAMIVVNKNSAKYSFENLSITVKLSVHANADYSWRFKNQNYFETQNNMHYNCKNVTLTIPYTGEYELEEKFVLERNELNYSVFDVNDLSHVFVEIIDVSGNVIVKK